MNVDLLRELEDEVKEWGNRHAESAAGNVRPRPIGHSSESQSG